MGKENKEILAAISSTEKTIASLNQLYLRTPLKRVSDIIIAQELLLRELKDLLK